jgi:hypothetical protein
LSIDSIAVDITDADKLIEKKVPEHTEQDENVRTIGQETIAQGMD